ncbi:MAG: hypothetical protein K2I75_08225 [Clostridiales bacterium]|nr:hypothetical protein [Clostridiales bacterium]
MKKICAFIVSITMILSCVCGVVACTDNTQSDIDGTYETYYVRMTNTTGLTAYPNYEDYTLSGGVITIRQYRPNKAETTVDGGKYKMENDKLCITDNKNSTKKFTKRNNYWYVKDTTLMLLYGGNDGEFILVKKGQKPDVSYISTHQYWEK